MRLHPIILGALLGCALWVLLVLVVLAVAALS